MINYRITVTYDQDKGLFRASAPELERCEVEAESRAEALERLEQEIEDRVGNMRAQGIEPPRPIDEQELDGELSIHVSRSLHRDLLYRAKLEQVELDAYLSELLTRSLTLRRGSGPANKGPDKRGRQREGQGQRYHDIMENRADFIEYVRRLDPSSGGGGRRGGGGGGGGRGRGGGGGKRRGD